jgi:hypothetical protein
MKQRTPTDDFFAVFTPEVVCILLVGYFAPAMWPWLVAYLVLRALWGIAPWVWKCLKNEVDLLRHYKYARHKMSRRIF